MNTTDNKPMGNGHKPTGLAQVSMELLPLIMNNIPQAVFWKDQNLVYLGCNQAFADDAGFPSPEDVIGKTDFDMPWKDQAELYRADDSLVMKTGKPKINYEEPQTSSNGSTTWLSTSKIPVHENGQVVAVLGMYEDITARKQAEEALLLRDRALASSLSAVIILNISENKPIYVNDALLKMTGYTREEVMQIGLADITGNPAASKEIRAAVQSQGFFIGEELIKRKDGSTFPASFFTSLIKDAKGQPLAVQSSFFDISERKQAEISLQESEERFRRFTEATEEGLVFHENGKIIDTNSAALAMFGLSDIRELIGKNLLDFIVSDWHKTVVQQMQLESVLPYEVQCIRNDGTIFPVETSTRAYKIGDKVIRASSIRDITGRKQLESQVQEAFERRGYQVQLSTEVSQEIAAATETDDLFDRVVKLTKERFGYYHTQLLRYDPAQGAVVLIHGYGATGQKMLAGGHKMPMGEGLIGTAAATGETVMRPTLADDPDWHPNPLLPDTKGEIAVPIKWQDNILGVLDVQSDQAGVLAEDDRLLLEGLCGQIAIAMHSAELVEILRQNETRLAEALKIARLGNWEYDFENDLFHFTDEFYAIFRTTAEKVGGYKISSADYAKHFVHPDDASLVGIEIQKVLDAKDRLFTTHLEHRIIFSDGEVGYISVHINVERDENGKITRWYGANQDITERKKAEEALRVNEARLAEALKIARLGNWEYDFENDQFHFTDEFYAIFRTSAEKVGGYKISSADYAKHFVHPEDAPLVGIEIQKVLDAKDRLFTTHLEHRIIFSDGEVGYISVNINVERDENGKITRWYGANQDITERKKAEEALRVNEARLTEALDAAKLAYWEHNLATNQFQLNDQYYATCHTTAEQEGGYTMSPERLLERFIHPEDRSRVGQAIAAGMQSAERHYRSKLDYRLIAADGSELGYMAIETNIERDEQGRVIRVYGSQQDITERKLAEEAMRANEARLAEALKIARLAHWEYNVEKDVFTFNDQFYSLFHTTAEQHGGYQVPSAYYAQHFVYPDDLPIVGVEIEKALNSTGRHYSRDIEHRILYADGGIGHIAVNINVDRDENGKITRYYGANQDITERKLAEARLAEALKAARLAHWEYDVEKDIFTFNDQFYSIFHTTAEKVGGYQLSSARYAELFVHPDDMGVVGAEIGKALNSTERVYNTSIDHRILYADGGVGYITVTLTVERDENGKITRYYGANQDITEQRKAQEEMAERLEEINRLYRSMSQEGWKTYRDTANLPKGFVFDQTGVKPVEETAVDEKSFASIPMKVLGGEVVGSLSVANDPHQPMSEEDLDFLQQASDQIALALEGARLAAQTQFALAQSERLFDASRRLTETKDLQDLTAAAVESINIPGINRAILCTLNYDVEGNVESMDVIANWWNGTGHQATAVGTHYPFEMVRMMKLFVSPTPLFFDDGLIDERVDPVTLELVKRLNLRAVAVLPLHVGTSQLGLLMLEGEEPHTFTQEETRLFTALGPQIATVLENRRQFERAQKQAQREAMLNVINQKIQGATSVEAVLQIAARELGHALGAPMTIAQLSMKDKSS